MLLYWWTCLRICLYPFHCTTDTVPFVTLQGTHGDSAWFKPTTFTVLELKATQSLMGLLPSRTRSSANYCGGCRDLSGSTRCRRIQWTVFCIGSSRGPLLGLHCDLCLLSPSAVQVGPKISTLVYVWMKLRKNRIINWIRSAWCAECIGYCKLQKY